MIASLGSECKFVLNNIKREDIDSSYQENRFKVEADISGNKSSNLNISIVTISDDEAETKSNQNNSIKSKFDNSHEELDFLVEKQALEFLTQYEEEQVNKKVNKIKFTFKPTNKLSSINNKSFQNNNTPPFSEHKVYFYLKLFYIYIYNYIVKENVTKSKKDDIKIRITAPSPTQKV